MEGTEDVSSAPSKPSSIHGRRISFASVDSCHQSGHPAETAKKDIWALILESKKTAARSCGAEKPDSHVFFVGSPQGGKSTLIARYINPDKEDPTKPTIGLEYTFARRTVPTSIERKVGRRLFTYGSSLDPRKLQDELMCSEHLLLPITALPTSVVIIVLDLSKPSELFDTLMFWLQKLQEKTEVLYAKLRKRGSRIPDQLVTRQKKLFGASHEDVKVVKWSGVPCIIVATKYDTFKDGDAEVRKIMARALRHAAHKHAASLLYTTGLQSNGKCQNDGDRCHNKAALNAFRIILNHLAFHTPPIKGLETDHSRLLMVPAGSDKFKDIGHPKGLEIDASIDHVTSEWRALFSHTFSPLTAKTFVPNRSFDPSEYREREIDASITQISEQLKAVDMQREVTKHLLSTPQFKRPTQL